MELRERVIFDEEAAADDLAKATFYNKLLTSKTLFEINKDEQNTLKPPKKCAKKRLKEKFSFGRFERKKVEKVTNLRRGLIARDELNVARGALFVRYSMD